MFCMYSAIVAPRYYSANQLYFGLCLVAFFFIYWASTDADPTEGKSMSADKQAMSINDLLTEYRNRIESKRDLGTVFERLTKSYLEHDPIQAARFRTVSMWHDWEHKWGQENGIDLVAEDHFGGFIAIQCKFYASDSEIRKENIDSFLSESSKSFKVNGNQKKFIERMIFATSSSWSKNAESAISNQDPPVVRIDLYELEQSSIDWSKFSLDKPEKITLKEKKKPRPHQNEAIQKVIEGFKTHDRGKLIMACGTGKTFTALKLMEKMVKPGGKVLFLVPSISLLSQSLREWATESAEPFNAFAVCSDSKVGKDDEDISKHDLAIPASTDTKSLIAGIERKAKNKQTTIIFSTYQSIDVVSQAQKKGLSEFDLIICDEAHRTTGVIIQNKEESHFVKIHDQKFIKGQKRLYMTATPRIFGSAAKKKAEEGAVVLCSMDDEALYGPEFHRLGFGKAVNENLLTDYKVLVLAVDERTGSAVFQKAVTTKDSEIPVGDVSKIIGCWNGLSKKFVGDEAIVEDRNPMKRAVAFARSIEDSKTIAKFFQGVVKEYIANNPSEGEALDCEVHHVDGSFNVLKRNKELAWLKEQAPANTCRILTNARCLSEGVDVPALDAVLFLNARDSMVDVVQSIGRIMRRAEGKKYGYVILPITIPSGMAPEEALKDNERYKVVWKVLQALRAHDDRLDAEINQIELNKKKSKKIIIGVGGGGNDDEGGSGKKKDDEGEQLSLDLSAIEQWKDAIYARIVLKCGSRPYWENWASDVAKIAERHTDHIKGLLKAPDSKPRKAFDKFLQGIRKNINPSISETEAIEMLSQHLITKPVFDALFEHYPFADKNPVSRSMQSVLKVLESGSFKEDAEKLKSFYDSVRMRVKGIDTPEGRQKVIVELYDRFFKVAFPKMSDRLGIVYTPVEVVDFIINSVEAVLKEEFGKSLSDKDVHILDPFTGTGTFIVRLLQSGIIKPEDLKRKFTKELHVNEIVLLAYYIAAINIEETYHGLTGGDYTPFDGIVLTDTFQLNEEEAQGSFESALPENSERVERQRKTPIQVIMSNPPYSAQQDSENDNNKRVSYPLLDLSIQKTYGQETAGRSKKNLFDDYVRAIRWASNRLSGSGIVGFITNASFIDSNNMNGLRKSLGKEFASIYCFNLRGNQRTSGELSRREGGKIFGSGSRTPVAITILIKKPNHTGDCKILYHDIGDYLSREEKLSIIKNFANIKSIQWEQITPNDSGDWIKQRSTVFNDYLSLADEGANDRLNSLTSLRSYGVVTNRDQWVYSFSKADLNVNLKKMAEFYNLELERLNKVRKAQNIDEDFVDDFVVADKAKISWTKNLKKDLLQNRQLIFDSSLLRIGLYRPYQKMNLCFDRRFVWSLYQIPKLFPTPEHKNLVIGVTGIGVTKPFSSLMTNNVPDIQLLANGQCFPLYCYEQAEDDLLKTEKPDKHGYVRRDAITDWALKKFQDTFSDKNISKEDIFYYIYGVLHSPTYRENFENDLKKMLPRIPLCKDFWGFSKAGRALAKWHIEYETVEPYDLKEEIKPSAPKKIEDLYRVDESGMKWPKEKKVEDKTKIIFNGYVTLTGVPLDAYDYVVNGKSAIEWVMERYCITVDLNKKGEGSGIKNDPNQWSDDSRYIVDLVKRVVRVSVETNKIVKALPPLDIIDDKSASSRHTE